MSWGDGSGFNKISVQNSNLDLEKSYKKRVTSPFYRYPEKLKTNWQTLYFLSPAFEPRIKKKIKKSFIKT